MNCPRCNRPKRIDGRKDCWRCRAADARAQAEVDIICSKCGGRKPTDKFRTCPACRARAAAQARGDKAQARRRVYRAMAKLLTSRRHEAGDGQRWVGEDPPGWAEHLDRLAARAELREPLFGRRAV